jgi:hypothetical protein
MPAPAVQTLELEKLQVSLFLSCQGLSKSFLRSAALGEESAVVLLLANATLNVRFVHRDVAGVEAKVDYARVIFRASLSIN